MVALAFLYRATAQTAHPAQPSAPVADPQQLFHEGEAALKKNNLDAAERSFRGVLALDPQAASAYANLGVISMRRNLGVAYFKKQELQRAKEEFLKDAALEPDVAYNYDQLGAGELAARRQSGSGKESAPGVAA